MDIRATLNEIMRLTEWNQNRLAAEIGVKQPSVSRWLAGSDPRGETRDRIKALLNRIQGGGEEAILAETASRLTRAPILSWVSASNLVVPEAPLPDEDLAFAVAFDLDPDGDWFALKVDGRSMDKISPPDSVIFVNRRDRLLVANACYVIATDDDGATSYKRYRPDPERWEPVSTIEHETLYASPEMSPRVIGRVGMTTLRL